MSPSVGEREPRSGPEFTVEVECLDRCPACGSERFEDWCESFDKQMSVSRQSFTYARCGACGVLFERVRPVEKEVGCFYPEGYGPHEGSAESELTDRPAGRRFNRRLVRSTRRLVLEPLSKLVLAELERRKSSAPLDDSVVRRDRFYAGVGEGNRFLDYGCGSNEFLDRMRDQGAETWGTDASEKVLERVRAGGHRTVPLADLHVSGKFDGFFDRIRMNHVIEHLYDPPSIVADLARITRPGGAIHVATPNAASPFARWFRESWFALDSPRHTVIFTPGSLTDLFDRAGFEGITIVDETKELDVVRSWSYLLVDRKLRKPPYTRFVDPRNLRWLSRPAKAWAEGRGVGDRIHLFARRSATPGAR